MKKSIIKQWKLVALSGALLVILALMGFPVGIFFMFGYAIIAVYIVGRLFSLVFNNKR